jgi:hypothetical protein
MSVSCCENMIIEDDKQDLLPSMKKMKLSSTTTPMIELKRPTMTLNETKDNLKKIFPHLSEEVIYNPNP